VIVQLKLGPSTLSGIICALTCGVNQPSTEFDANYLQALAAAQEDAQAQLVTTLSRRMKLALRSRLRSPQAVEDAFQETLLRVLVYFRSGKTLRTPASLPAFVESICTHVALESGRASKRHDQIPAHLPDPVDTSSNPERRLLAEERRCFIRRTLQVLRARDRDVLTKLFLEEEDRRAVCEQFNISEQHLRLVLHRARARLRRVIDDSNLSIAA
jgi:RNA polymerase sigma-70 factor (ECF subfamily)